MTKKLIAVLAVAMVFGLVGVAIEPASAAATDDPPATATKRAAVVRHARPRIEVRPAQLLYRECVDTTREVWRPYWGYVVMPDMRCRWVRR